MVERVLDRVHVTRKAGSPFVRIKLYDDDGDLVDMTSGFTGFTARVARKSSPTVSVLTISGVTGITVGFLIPAHDIALLSPTPLYVLTAAATETATGEPRAAQTELVIDPSPL